jgi:predicted nucleotidyltransferase
MSDISHLPFLADPTQVSSFCQRHHISYLGLFGSHARTDYHDGSDIDLMVAFSEPKTLFDLAALEQELETLIGKDIDIVIKDHLKSLIKPYIEQDLLTLYEETPHE